MQEFKVLEEIARTPGKKDKMYLLSKCNTPSMRTFLYLTYDKFLTYRIQQIEYPQYYNTVQPDISQELKALLLGLAKHDTGSVEARKMIKRLLAKCTEEGAGWVVKIVQRDLKIGLDEKSINKVFPELIPVFNVQLANKVDDWCKIDYPVIVEEKLDGTRCIAVIQEGTVNFYSREGREFRGLECIADEILTLMPGFNFVLDGEVIAKKFNPHNKTAVKNKDGNWPFAQALSMLKNHDTTRAEVEEYLGYYCWDVIDIEYFQSQGTKGKSSTQTERKCHLEALFSRNKTPLKSVFMVPNVIAKNQEEVLTLFQQVRDKRGEGVMLKKMDAPYAFRRNDNILKLKEFYTLDLRIVGAYEGGKGTKYEGMLGALVVADDTGKIKSDVGSGFSDSNRTELWLRYLNGDLKGAIVEIMFQEITSDGSLRFPTYVGERFDKTKTSLI